MKNIVNFCLAVLLISGISACSHEPTSRKFTGEYMIIGPGGGFRPPVGTYYYLSSTQLLADTAVILHSPPSDISLFKFDSVLPSAKHATVKDVLTGIPSEILRNNHGEFGISTLAVDGGYTVVRTKVNGIHYDWLFHDNMDGTDVDIRQFADKIRVVFK